MYSPVETADDPKAAREFRRVAEASNLVRLIVYTQAPVRPPDGMLAICDGVNWNPLGDSIKRPLWFDAAGQVWKKFA